MPCDHHPTDERSLRSSGFIAHIYRMSNRLSQIVTKTGDQGLTSLGDGQRISKSHPRIQALGSVDELNSALGLLLCCSMSNEIIQQLQFIQHRLFDAGAEICIPGYTCLKPEHIERLESHIKEQLEDLPDLQEFILPGGTESAARAHICRSIARRAERDLFSLNDNEAISDNCLQLLNRLSDYFFVLARTLNKEAGLSDVFWQKDH